MSSLSVIPTSTVLLGARVSETRGESLANIDVTMAIAPYRTLPTVWEPPTTLDVDGTVLTAWLLTTVAPGKFTVYVRLASGAEDEIKAAGTLNVPDLS